MNDKNFIIRQALDSIFTGVKALRKAFPGKEFTIDGRLVGDLGEVIAAMNYDIKLYPKSQCCYDGEYSDGRKVGIKATFQNSLTFGEVPDYYLGLQLFEDGNYKEIYNGPGILIFNYYSHRAGIGKKLLRFPNNVLETLSKQVSPSDRIS